MFEALSTYPEHEGGKFWLYTSAFYAIYPECELNKIRRLEHIVELLVDVPMPTVVGTNTQRNRDTKMTYWKVDLLNPALGVPKTHWFRNSHDAEQFCDRIPCSPYATSYYCREVRLPDQILDAARREALKRVNASKAPPAPEEADPLRALRVAC